MKIGITGATGQLGRLVLKSLQGKAHSAELVALVRSPEKAEDLDVEVRSFDYTETGEQLSGALDGIATLLLISSSEIGKRRMQHSNVVRAAKEAGVKRIVYTSLLHADTSSINLAGEHIESEQIVKDSGLPYSILRNGWYTENYLGSVSQALASGKLIGSAGDGKISAATRKDYAEAAAHVLTTEGHEGKVYELAGDDAFTLSDLAAEVSRISGKEVTYVDLPEKDYAAELEKAGLPQDLAGTIASWDRGIAQGDLYDGDKVLSALIGRPTTPLEETVKTVIQHL